VGYKVCGMSGNSFQLGSLLKCVVNHILEQRVSVVQLWGIKCVECGVTNSFQLGSLLKCVVSHILQQRVSVVQLWGIKCVDSVGTGRGTGVGTSVWNGV
jgi:hypothetical protein